MSLHYDQLTDIIPGLQSLWEETFGDPSIKIAVIDGPVDITHSALASAQLEIQPTHLFGSGNDFGKATQHGTHVASIIFGQHNKEVKGIAPACSGLILPVFKDDPNGEVLPCSQVDLARSILQAATAGAQVINISGGEFSASGAANTLLANAIEYCRKQQILVVAAAGNDGCACLHIPGATPSVLAVGAMDKEGAPLAFSNWGGIYRNQGILAPGENIVGATISGGLERRTGTSYATPIIAGIGALLMSLQKKKGLKPDGNMVREVLLETATICNPSEEQNCQRFLKGRLNVKEAIAKILTKNRIMTSENQNNPKPEFTNSAMENHLEQEKTGSGQVMLAHHEEEPLLKETITANVEDLIKPSSCGCGGGEGSCSCNSKKREGKALQMIYALGTIGYDFGAEAARESLAQHMDGNPNDPTQLLTYLDQNPWEASALTWTLKMEATPIYAIHFQGPYAAEGYRRLQEFYSEQIKKGVDRVSIPGFIVGQTRLLSGQTVPLVFAELRCMYSWNTEALVNHVVGKAPAGNAKKEDKKAYEEQQVAVINFLERIYHELRNLGLTPQERAINYAATNALNVAQIFGEALKEQLQLDTIEVEQSTINSISSECWEVIMCFFDPQNQMTRARKCYRFIIDLSYVCPVMIGEVRSWYVR